MTVLPDRADRNGFFSTLQGKLIAALTIIALSDGCRHGRHFNLGRNLMETHTSTEVSMNSELRQKADAEKAKAKSCSARMKYMVKSSTLEELEHPGKKWDDLKRECDPSYAAQADACDKSFNAILADLDKIHNDEEGKPVLERFNKHKQTCVITAEQRQRFAAFKEKNDQEVEKIHKAQAMLEILKSKVSR